jgi:hypothetical protein
MQANRNHGIQSFGLFSVGWLGCFCHEVFSLNLGCVDHDHFTMTGVQKP